MKVRLALPSRVFVQCAVLGGLLIARTSRAREFTLSGATFDLQDVTTNVDVYFTSMRLNRAANEWDVDVSLSNKVDQALSSPVILLVESYTGTSGPLRADGVSSNQFFFDLSGQMSQGLLSLGTRSVPRTIGLGFVSGSAPKLVTRVYAGSAGTGGALAFSRSLNDVGQPLPGVGILGTGPLGGTTNGTEAQFGVATLGQTPGDYVWEFDLPGYLPVWRRAVLESNAVSVIPYPRLTARSPQSYSISPLSGGAASNQTVRVDFNGGAVGQNTTARLTSLDGQSLPAFLPQGWSPLQAFWLEVGKEPNQAVEAELIPWGPISSNETATLVRFDSATLNWIAIQAVVGHGTNAIHVSLAGSGAYALVVPDAAPIAPPAAVVGEAIQASTVPSPDAANLVAGGTLTPTSSPASTSPEAVTATAAVTVTNLSGPLASGTLLRGEVSEHYLLRNGATRHPPQFDAFIVGYQRPGDTRTDTLSARFPLRPTLLFGPETLNEGVVHVDLFAPGTFTGGILDTNGGIVANGGVKLLAAPGTMLGREAVQLRNLDVTNFTDLAGSNSTVVAAFEVGLSGVAPGHELLLQVSGLPANQTFVLARVVGQTGPYGLEPRERLHTDANGNLVGDEPTSGDRLPGLAVAGQYVLLEVQPQQGLVEGIARDSNGQASGGLPVSIDGQPWLTFSAPDGSFKLLAPSGSETVNVSDPTTGDSGSQTVSVPVNLNPVTTSVSSVATGLQVSSVTPADNATNVAQVTSVVMTFNRAVNPGTLVGDAIQLLGGSNQPVAATVSLDLANTVATLLPNYPLDAATQFTISVSSNITDTLGRTLVGSNRFTFTTVPVSIRDAAAQLIIYQPGATNLDTNVLAELPGYVPGTNNLIVVHGTPGAADPGVPVIVVNEGTGEATTVLSKSDGSFTTYVSGQEQDFISATFVNLNGTRVYVPVNRQLFDDGSVGLYSQGGTLTAQGDGGPVQITVPPNAIPERTKFKLEPINTNELESQLDGVTPQGATIAGGALHLHIEGQPPSLPMQASFPADLGALGFPTNEPASNAVIALTMVRDTQGVKTFQYLDQMLFSTAPPQKTTTQRKRPRPLGGEKLAGFIFTATGFAPGAVGLVPLVYDWVVVPTLMLGTRPVVVTGQTLYYQVGDPDLGQALISKQALSGTYVVLTHLGDQEIGQPGRLQPGWVYATSGANGRYSLIAPFAGEDYLLQATHPQFNDSPKALITDLVHTGGAVQDFVFRNPLTNQLTPRVTVANAPQYPAAGQACQVQVNASQPLGGPPNVEVKESHSTTNLFTGLVETNVQVTLANVTSTPSGNSTVWSGTLTANKPIRVVLNIKVTGARQSVDPFDYPISFVGVPPLPTNNIIPAPDTNDIHGPLVISTQPSEAGYVDESGRIKIFFNKPIDTYVNEHPEGIVLSGSSTPVVPVVRLSADQQVLTLQYPGLEPNKTYRLTLSGASIMDLGGKPLDQRPSTLVADSFAMTFRSAPVVVADLPGIANGKGAVISGNRLYALDQAPQGNYLVAYDISIPSAPKILGSKIPLLGAPRDLVVVPQFSYVTSTHSTSIITNDLVAVVGGDLDTVTLDTGGGQAPIVRGKGQYLTVFDMGNPAAPRQLASPIVTYRVGSAVTKVRWAPPYLVYQEFGADIQSINFVNLQEMIIGFGSSRAQQDTFPIGGKPGLDLNGDGDYVDPGEKLPLPDGDPPEFYGKHQSLVLQHSTQKILDFSVTSRGGTVGVTLKGGIRLDNNGASAGETLPPQYRTFSYNNQVMDLSDPHSAALPFDASVYPRWVKVLNSFEVVSNGFPVILPSVALVSLEPDSDGAQKLAIIDISLPLNPRLLSKIPIPESLLGGAIESVSLRSDGLLQVAGAQNLVLLDPGYLLTTNVPAGQLHPAIADCIPRAGGITRSIGSTDYGLYAVADGARDGIVEAPPRLSFVSFPNNGSVVDPRTLHVEGDDSLASLMQTMRTAGSIPPARFQTNFDIPSDLNPPNPALHFHVLMHAPGDSGYSIELGLEAVNLAGRPLGNRGSGFAPVRAVTENTQKQLGQTPRSNCGAPIRSLTAYRMSDNPHSPYYNTYLSRPFALVCEKISSGQIADLQSRLDREILFSSFALRAFIDPQESKFNSVIGKFAGQIDDQRKLIFPVSQATAFTLDRSYIPGNNPPPAGGAVKLSGTYGTVCAQSGELRIDATDMVLPSPRMAIEIRREIGGQDTYEGPFGVGWDFNYNQRLTVLDPELFPAGLQMPVVVRDTKQDSDVAGSQDVLFHTGLGRELIFHWVDTNMPPEYASDPLVSELNYQKYVSDYYLPAKHQGVFDLLVKFKDGRFERLTPGGMRYRYASDGRLETIIDRFPKNHHDLEYDRNGWLIRIDDHSVSADRYVEFGHYRRLADPDFNAGLDEQTDNSFLEGKICRIRDYAGADVLYQYSAEGFLTNRMGKVVAGENGGFSGRGQVQYLYSNCRIVGLAATAQGVPIFSTVSATSSDGKSVVQSGNGINGPVQVGVPIENSAAKVNGEVATVGLGDGSMRQHQFDKYGHPTSSSVSGPNGPTATSETQFDDNGLLVFLKHPEGNTETMTYDTDNVVFRSRGNLLSRTVDPGPRGGEGYTETFHYDPMYNLQSGSQTTPNGFVWTFALRPDKREVASITYGAAGTATFGYNDNGQLTSHTDIRGVQTTLGYDSGTGFIKTQTLGNNTYDYNYSGDYASQLGQPSSIDLPEGAPMTFRYNANLQKVQWQRGDLLEKFGYDEEGNTIYHEQHPGDGKTLITHSAYDVKGFLKTNILDGVEINGQTSSLEYDFTPDPLSRVEKIYYPQGTVRTFQYDNRGNVVGMKLGDYEELYDFDLNNNLTAIHQGGDLVRTTEYDGLDRPKTVTRKTGTGDEIETRTFYRGGQLKSRTSSDPQYGEVSQLTDDQIDELGRPVRRIITGTTVSPSYQFSYQAGSETKVGPRMSTTRKWDTAGYETEITDAILDEVQHPDGMGRVIQIDRHEDGATYNQFFEYDPQGNRTSASDNFGPRFFFHARADGKLMSVTNANGHTTEFDYSVLNELLKKRREDGMEFRFQHNAVRQTVFSGDPQAGFQFSFDNDFRLKTHSLRNGAAFVYSDFDPRKKPQKADIPGGSMTMSYDLLRRLTDQTVNYQSTTYELHQSYDALDRVRRSTFKQDGGALNTISYTFDEAGPLLSAEFQEDGSDMTVGYAYNSDLSRKSITYPSSAIVTETRDNSGRLTGVSDSNGNIIKATSWQGNVEPKTVQLGSAINIANQYDLRGRLVASRVTQAGTGTVLVHMRYQLDAANNLLVREFLHRGGKADSFFYDAGERLSRAQIGSEPITGSTWAVPLFDRNYNYHAAGLDYLTSTFSSNLTESLPPFATNWTAHDDFLLPSVVDGFDRGQADPMGNVAQALLQVRPAGAAAPIPVSATLTHNGNGSLVRVTRADGVVEENFFQPNGLRYARRISQGSTVLDDRLFIYDGNKLLEEYEQTNGSPQLIARYYYGSSDAPDAADLRVPLNGSLHRYYFLKDNMQSVIAVADATGTVVERVWYDPFGQPFIEQRDTAAPKVRSVVGGSGGSLLIAFSEPVQAPTSDPGPGQGIVYFKPSFTNAVSITGTNGAISGTTDLIPSEPGFPPYSVLLFSSTQSVTGALTIKLNPGTLADEWGNSNAAQTVSLTATGAVGTVYYQAQPDPQTGPERVARSSVGSPFLFHGQYFDYDTGLIYLRARFYDPYSGMFLEPDPLGYENSVNLYAGMGNNPVAYRDPTGLAYLNPEEAAKAERAIQEAAGAVRGAERISGESRIVVETAEETKQLAPIVDQEANQVASSVAKAIPQNGARAERLVVLGLKDRVWESAKRLQEAFAKAKDTTYEVTHFMWRENAVDWARQVRQAAIEAREGMTSIRVNLTGLQGGSLEERIKSAILRGFEARKDIGNIEMLENISTGQAADFRKQLEANFKGLPPLNYNLAGDMAIVETDAGRKLFSSTDLEIYLLYEQGALFTDKVKFLLGPAGEAELKNPFAGMDPDFLTREWFNYKP